MVSLASLFWNLFSKNKIVQVRRLPPRKVLRAHQLGLTLAILFALLVIFLNFLTLPFYITVLSGLVFVLGTYWGGPFVILASLYLLFFVIVQKAFGYSPKGVFGILSLMTTWYLGGYSFGAILALLYNDLVFIHLFTVCKDSIKTVFAYKDNEVFNIIKSPKSEELTVQLHDLKSANMLYDYKLEKVPAHPYTIAFVANPQILQRKKKPDEKDIYLIDPIIENKKLFYRSVDKALSAFEQNEVVGRPEIWSRIRIVTLFDETLKDEDGTKYSLVQPSQNIPELDGVVAENLLDPTDQMHTNYASILRRTDKLSMAELNEYLKETDVIFALSASPDFDRSTAHYSDWIENEKCFKIKTIKELMSLLPSTRTPDIRGKIVKLKDTLFNGERSILGTLEDLLKVKIDNIEDRKSIISELEQLYDANPSLENIIEEHEYDYDADPEQTKNDEIYKINFGDSNCQFKRIHERYAKIPGRVALNVLEARTKTYIHEFAHAMSSAFHGAIVDEYFDKYESAGAQNDEEPHFYINRIERKKYLNGKIVPVHKIFAKYNHVIYFSDLAHPSAEEEWTGYFPDRKCPFTTCIMDRTYDKVFRFDELISQFMYDRLVVKINR